MEPPNYLTLREKPAIYLYVKSPSVQIGRDLRGKKIKLSGAYARFSRGVFSYRRGIGCR